MANSQTFPSDRVRIFDRNGVPVAEFKTSVTRSWAIGMEGRAQFSFATRKTDVVNDDVLGFGNWLLVQNTALPDWVGVIDYPRNWTTRAVTVSAYTPERVFAQRIGPTEQVKQGTPGGLFAVLIKLVNQAELTVIRGGSIFRHGKSRQMTLNPKLLSEYLKSLWEQSGEDYAWRPMTTTNGRLIVMGDWVQMLGADTTALLHEGSGGGNIEAVGQIMVEDGPIINSVLAFGEGENWKSKPSATVIDASSIGQYGLRETSEEYSGVSSVSTLIENATEKINEFKQPARSFSLNAINVGDTFQYIRLGNILNLQFQNLGFRGGTVGFSSRVRIVGMSYNPVIGNKVQIVAREVV
jgi:hypothetical protein